MTKNYLIPLLLLASLCASATAETPLRTQLKSALLGTDPLQVVRKMAVMPKARLRREGITVVDKSNDQEAHELIFINLAPPLSLYGATTRAVVLDPYAEYKNFQGLVFAEFDGDLKRFVSAAKLKKGKPKNTTPVGVFNRPLSQGDGCPTTLGATPLGGKRFVFGAGWCNGG